VLWSVEGEVAMLANKIFQFPALSIVHVVLPTYTASDKRTW
jgi:hypothetical protein